MLIIKEIIKILKKNNINFFTGVPDSILKNLSSSLSKLGKKNHIDSYRIFSEFGLRKYY